MWDGGGSSVGLARGEPLVARADVHLALAGKVAPGAGPLTQASSNNTLYSTTRQSRPLSRPCSKRPPLLRFISFKVLKRLRQLHVDFTSIGPWPRVEFPDTIEDLTPEGFQGMEIRDLISSHYQAVGCDCRDRDSKAIALMATKFPPLRRLVWSIDLDVLLEPKPADVIFLRYAADQLLEMGFAFEIHRSPILYDGESEVIVKSGWTAPRRHSF